LSKIKTLHFQKHSTSCGYGDVSHALQEISYGNLDFNNLLGNRNDHKARPLSALSSKANCKRVTLYQILNIHLEYHHILVEIATECSLREPYFTVKNTANFIKIG